MNKEPKIGQKIYVQTSLYVYRGRDDFTGGIATISKIEHDDDLPKDHRNYTMIGIEERESTMYNWKVLLKEQEELKKEYGDQIAHPNPDYDEDVNCPDADWQTPGKS